MDDLISRQAAINAIDECYCGGEDSCGEPWIYKENAWIYKENAVEAINMIEPIPSAEPKSGRWVLVCDNNGMHFICNKCGAWRYHQEQKFCGECGADMREVNHESD